MVRKREKEQFWFHSRHARSLIATAIKAKTEHRVEPKEPFHAWFLIPDNIFQISQL